MLKRKIKVIPLGKTDMSYWRNTKKVKPTLSTIDLERMRELYKQCSKNPKTPNLYFVEGYGLCKEIER